MNDRQAQHEYEQIRQILERSQKYGDHNPSSVQIELSKPFRHWLLKHKLITNGSDQWGNQFFGNNIMPCAGVDWEWTTNQNNAAPYWAVYIDSDKIWESGKQINSFC